MAEAQNRSPYGRQYENGRNSREARRGSYYQFKRQDSYDSSKLNELVRKSQDRSTIKFTDDSKNYRVKKSEMRIDKNE